MTPSEALVAEGVKNVFGIVGSAYMDALDLFPAARIIMAARYPVIVSGGGVSQADAVDPVKAIASNRPCVINAIVQGGEEVLAEPFRRDALNMPVRYLDKYSHLNAK